MPEYAGIQDMNPADKLVYTVLEHRGWLRQGEIIEETRLPMSTFKDSIQRLKDRGLIEERPCVSDPRAMEYDLR